MNNFKKPFSINENNIYTNIKVVFKDGESGRELMTATYSTDESATSITNSVERTKSRLVERGVARTVSASGHYETLSYFEF